VTDTANPALPAVDVPVVAAAALPEQAAAAPAIPEVKPFAAADEPTALETFVADKAAADAAKEAAKPVEVAKPAEPEKPVDPAAKAPDAKAAEPAKDPAKPDAAAAAVEAAKPVDSAKLEPLAYEYKLPETLKMDDGLKTKVHGAFDAFRADPSKGVQGLIDLHNEQMQAYATDYSAKTAEAQQRAFADTRKDWVKQLMADPELGGAGYQTAMGAVARVRDLALSSHPQGSKGYQEDAKNFDQFLRITGAGDHPAFLRLLHNLARYVDEPQASEAPSNIKPAPTNGKAPGDFKATMYDHPRSNGRTP
jgi:hypothetical protein